MAENTKIQWTDATWGPIRARSKETGKVFHWCERVSSGCANCFAATMAQRFGLPDYIKANRDKVEFFLDEETLKKPLSWKKPKMVFVESCSDLFGDWVEESWLDRVFAIMALTTRHTYQVLTKRPERMREYASAADLRSRIDDACGQFVDGCRFHGDLPPWPLPNCWKGVSVEHQATADERIPVLLQTPAAVRFLSCEPLLGPVELRHVNEHNGTFTPSFDAVLGWRTEYQYKARNESECSIGAHSEMYRRVDWVIVGGESGGPNARPCNVEWIRSIVRQCQAARVACFVKQLGSKPGRDGAHRQNHAHDPDPAGTHREFTPLSIRDHKGGDIEEFPADLRVREFPR